MYEELERIIRTNDYHHSRIEQLRRRLTGWIHSSIESSNLLTETAALLVNEISTAPMNAFRPSIWRLDLARIEIARLKRLGQFPDEYLLGDVIGREFEVVT